MRRFTKNCNLYDCAPELVKEWHPSANGTLTPRSVRIAYPRKVWWICAQSHEWQATIKTRLNGSRCPLCALDGKIVNIPEGPKRLDSDEKPAEPVELRIYPGADGSFTLYEDENDNYNYEKGKYATITFYWNDAKRQLTIGNRKGEFPGMLVSRHFNVVIVKEGHGTGVDITTEPDRIITCNGNKHIIKF